MHRATTSSPIGVVDITVDGSGRLVSLVLSGHEATPVIGTADRVALPVVDAVDRYFAGEIGALDDIEVVFDRGTDFQREVWSALRSIPLGTTISYAELAARVGRPSAHRAVGSANGANPVAVAVPCHRVVAADGGLGGYGYGLDAKRWLLEHEGASIDATLPGLA